MTNNTNLRQDITYKYDSNGTYSYLDAGGEQTVIEFTDDVYKIIAGVWLDLSNMTQDGTVKAYYKIDGTNYRQVSIDGTTQSFAFTVADTIDGFFVRLNAGIVNDFKITYTEGGDEGAARDIVYQLIYQ